MSDEKEASSPEVPNKAVALRYLAGDFEPKVVAKGRGFVAEEIIKYAKEHNVFIHESEDLVSLLMQVDFDRHIPDELYSAIAEILAWIYELESSS